MDATWHSGPRGSATRAHSAPKRRIYTYIFYIFYIVGVFSLPYIKRVFKPPNPSGLINPTGFTNLFCVRLKSHTVISISGYVAGGGALDQNRDEDRASMRWTRGPPDLRSTHVFLKPLK